MEHNVHENVFATGISLEEIEEIKSQMASKYRLAIRDTDDDGTEDQLSKKTQGYLVWLLECCDNIVKAIANGDNYPTTCVRIGVLRQEMANIIPPLLTSKAKPTLAVPAEFIQAVYKGGVTEHFRFNSFTISYYDGFEKVAKAMGYTVDQLNTAIAKGYVLPEDVLAKITV
jgi:hypothetical protein